MPSEPSSATTTSPNVPARYTRTGQRFWLPVVASLVAAIILIPIVWVGLAHWVSLSLGTAAATPGRRPLCRSAGW